PASGALRAETARRSMFQQFQAAQFAPLAVQPINHRAGSRPLPEAFRRCKSKFSLLEFVTGHERVNHDGRADQWQGDKGEPDFWSGKILRSNRADLCADDCTGMHDQRDQNVDVAFDRMSDRSITGGNDDLEKI